MTAEMTGEMTIDYYNKRLAESFEAHDSVGASISAEIKLRLNEWRLTVDSLGHAAAAGDVTRTLALFSECGAHERKLNCLMRISDLFLAYDRAMTDELARSNTEIEEILARPA